MDSSIFKTLVYADIFDYPLTASEINHWLISQKSNLNKFTLKKTNRNFKKNGNYYHLPKRSHLVKLRHQRTYFSNKKIKLAKRVGKWLKIFPTIKMVAVTGALAMNNADKDDDIDLMIVISANRLWLTRLFISPFLAIFFKLRRPANSKKPPAASFRNSICLNLWLDQTALSMSKSRQNLFIAHEIAQTKVLWDRGDTYKTFLTSNKWINKFLPNIKIPKQFNINSLSLVKSSHNKILENIAFKMQFAYMKKRITYEKISLHSAFFHPNNIQNKVLTQYNQAIKKLDTSAK